MANKKKKEIPQEQLQLYEKLVESIPELEINATFGFPYTSLNGHMFSLLSKSGYVGIRLSKDEREAFLVKHNSTIYKPEPGPLLKEYVTVPHDLLRDTQALREYLVKSLEYVKTLKPKSQKKK